MKREHKYWPYLILLVLCVVFSAGYLTLAQEQQESLARAQESPADAQSSDSISQQTTGTAGVATKHAVVNFSQLARQELLMPTPYREQKAIRKPGTAPLQKAVPVGAVAVMEERRPEASNAPAQSLIPSPDTTSRFRALEDNNTSIPPDTNGAVGPNHLMVTLNSQVRIQSRTGVNISTIALKSFWAALGNPNALDPKVVYDPFNNRWIFTCVADPGSSNSSVLIGVSLSSDPTGNWKLWKVDADSTDQTWADYPSLGFNKNWIVVTVNMFSASESTYSHANIYAFNKANLYASGTTAAHRRFKDFVGMTKAPAVTYDNALNTMYLVENWDGQTILRISSLTGTAAAPTYSSTHYFPTVYSPDAWAFNPYNFLDFAPQLGSDRKIQNNDSRIQNVVYRNGSLWCTHTIFLVPGGIPMPTSPASLAAGSEEPPTRSAVQWWQLSPTGTIEQRGRIEDVTELMFYAYPSIAVNKNNDVLIGFSRFSMLQYASANYAFRAGTDPLNTMRADLTLKAGTAPYDKDFDSGDNRWGDYSSTVVDPVNDVDMWTLQEYAAPASSTGQSFWGTWWGRIALGPPLIGLSYVTYTDTSSDPDIIIEPGETGKLNVRLRNSGNAPATGVSARLTTSTPGVTITQANSAYPNLAPGTNGMNTTPFTFKVSRYVSCGQNLTFTITATYTGGGSPKAHTFTVPTGRVDVPLTRTRTGAAVAIPDERGVYIPFVVSGFTGTISDLNFKIGGTTCTAAAGATTVGLDHTRVSDLTIELESPQGTTMTLMNWPGLNNNVENYGNNFCNTVLDDEPTTRPSIQTIKAAQAPYTGTFRPKNALSVFDGQNPNGTWYLHVLDEVSGETGHVRSFSLIITAYECSTMALATPVEIQSDRALANLPASRQPTVAQSQREAEFEQTPRAFDSASQLANIAHRGGTQQGSPATQLYLEELFTSARATPSQIEGEWLWSAFTLKRNDYLIRLLAG